MQTVVITGGSAGIGRAVAEIYAGRGCRIGVIARGEERLEDAAAELRGLGAAEVATVLCRTSPRRARSRPRPSAASASSARSTSGSTMR